MKTSKRTDQHITESIVLCTLETGFDKRQSAHRSHRGAETHLLELYDFIKERENEANLFYLAAVDVDGAFWIRIVLESLGQTRSVTN